MKAWTAVLAWVSLSPSFVFANGMMSGGGALVVDGPAGFASAESDPTENIATSLRAAAREGRLKEIQRLLDQGADPNRSGEFGETALMYAARFNQRQVADLLLEHHAEVNARDSKDNTALEMAAKNCSSGIGARLIAHGADVNWFNSEGKTPLITAAQNGCADLVQAILKVRGVRLDQRDNNGTTALDYALVEAQAEVGGAYSEIAKLLRKAGAKTSQWQELPPQAAPRPQIRSKPLP